MSNADFFDCVEPQAEGVLNGYNGTIMPYGQTGTGKTLLWKPEKEGIVKEVFPTHDEIKRKQLLKCWPLNWWDFTNQLFDDIYAYYGAKIGSLLSIYGCYQYHNKFGGHISGGLDEEQAEVTRMPNAAKYIVPKDHKHSRHVDGVWGYVFQIMFQMQAGVVVLTDCVFWFIMVPFVATKDYNLHFLIIIMHSINVVFLIGATALNNLVVLSFS